MRVITGAAKGRRLEAPDGLDTRPTGERIKEAMFSIVQFEIEQAFVLDLFSGSGQLGIEALSRGARRVVLVDSSRASVSVIRENLAKTRLEENARVIQADCLAYLRTTPDIYDVVFLAPPYASDLHMKTLEALAPRIHPYSTVICETEKKSLLPESVGLLTEKKEHLYGKTKVTVYRSRRDDL